MSADPRAQGEKDDFCGLSTCEKRKGCIFEGGNMSGGPMPEEVPGKPAEGGEACSKKDFKQPLKIDIPKDNPHFNPKYSSQTPIVLNKLPIFEEKDPNH
ncbi:hypothetical protein KPH14_011101 [Odynerus spinipes]|uniref:Uncharacterized protein n=1 Tax=Odynerus spinipes TaxID=1348599 RepID=A0AAD9RHB6_9HYME|nr:hypothetical protein KPH14_011101 [Odynerus spinipes]